MLSFLGVKLAFREVKMKLVTLFKQASLSIGLVCGLSTALAAPIIDPNTTYDFRVFAVSSGGTTMNATFDGVAESFLRGSVTVRLTETQTDLGGGQFSVVMRAEGDGDLYPVANETGGLRLGGNLDPLNLLAPVTLDAAILTMFNAAGAQIASADFVAAIPASFSSLSPWDAAFVAAPTTSGAFSSIGGRGVTTVQLELRLSTIPEPGTLALLGLGLAGLAATRKRKQ